MKRKTVLFIILGVVALILVSVFYRSDIIFPAPFDSGGRYDPSVLDDMGVAYANRSDIRSFNEAYSESDNCPWGFVHNGIDYAYFNDSDVIAAAPGLVERINLNDWGSEAQHRYTINVEIRFNETVKVIYHFEPWTNSTDEQAQQVEMFNFEVGTWVTKGEVIAKFLVAGNGAHIHFGVVQNEEWRDPSLYMSTEGYNELLGMIQDFHPTWEISYP